MQEVGGERSRANSEDLRASPSATPAAQKLVVEMLDRQLQAIVAHEPGTRLGADPEELHDMRVGTRRARALLRTASPLLEPSWTESLRSELAWLGGTLGAVRDLDVFLARLKEGITHLDDEERRAAQKLVAAVGAQRAEARETLVAVLDSTATRRSCGRWPRGWPRLRSFPSRSLCAIWLAISSTG